MNKHFEDARYYLLRAGHHVKLGLEESLEPVETKVRSLTGRELEPEPESEPSRVETLLEEAKSVERKAESEARETIGGARQKLESYRTIR
ncbi:hypothetical protein OB955_23990 [Halobacteria archaeon AArc-m2/3/4]|uniref:Uncharacterized protein n=1 Tax=Natronoglomus mannanivorans TaxID=2979990 RepID=A0ABT2QLI6_9EURY|nr:hypothetical protein [Halobacteria archaeon AArc-m2/3/4]